MSAYAIDVIAGSTLTAQSLLGPNPGLGVRFFGIGNELESMLAVTIPVGVGAALMSARERFGEEITGRTAAIAFLARGRLLRRDLRRGPLRRRRRRGDRVPRGGGDGGRSRCRGRCAAGSS